MEDCAESGAEDYSYTDDLIEITTDTASLRTVREYLEGAGYKLSSAQAEYIPSTTVKLEDPALIEKMYKLLDLLEDNDDVQNVWHNWEMPEEDEED